MVRLNIKSVHKIAEILATVDVVSLHPCQAPKMSVRENSESTQY